MTINQRIEKIQQLIWSHEHHHIDIEDMMQIILEQKRVIDDIKEIALDFMGINEDKRHFVKYPLQTLTLSQLD